MSIQYGCGEGWKYLGARPCEPCGGRMPFIERGNGPECASCALKEEREKLEELRVDRAVINRGWNNLKEERGKE